MRSGRVLLWTAMKEGLLGGTLGVSSKSELEEAHAHVARWIGSESTSARRLSARWARQGGWRGGGAAGCRWPARFGRPSGWSSGARGDRVDERRAVRA